MIALSDFPALSQRSAAFSSDFLVPFSAWVFPFPELAGAGAGFPVTMQTQFCEFFPLENRVLHCLRKRLATKLASRMRKKKSQVKVAKTTYL